MALPSSVNDKEAQKFVEDPSGDTAVRVISGDETKSLQVDSGSTYVYVGRAESGSATSSAVWRICRITKSSGVKLWADSGKYSQIWDNRASLTYA